MHINRVAPFCLEAWCTLIGTTKLTDLSFNSCAPLDFWSLYHIEGRKCTRCNVDGLIQGDGTEIDYAVQYASSCHDHDLISQVRLYLHLCRPSSLTCDFGFSKDGTVCANVDIK